MTILAMPQAAPRSTSVVLTTLLGTGLVAAGLVSAYLTIATPLVPALVPASRSEQGMALGLAAWSFSLVFGGSLLAAGTSRLALVLASIRGGGRSGGPAARALAGATDETVVSGAVIPLDGPVIPEVVVGSFGLAVVHALPPASRIRQTSGRWEARSDDGWRPIASPLDAAARDADRVRRWLSLTDMDFVVRVYAAVVTPDQEVPRTAGCAVLRQDQIGAWLASLPRQRTLTPGRRERLVGMLGTRGAPDRAS